ncbi:GTPase [Trichothermofontia sp.]
MKNQGENLPMNISKLNLANVYSKFDRAIEDFQRLLKSSNRSEVDEYLKKLDAERKAIRTNPVLKLAFIGQYSAGKSTIVSALTGDRKIATGAGITTDTATTYDWNGIQIIDTPGIGTEWQDHDEITYQAIEQADLLVFCTTHMLLDDHIIKHFRKLAYEKRYSHKMMLIINKLSAEAGDDDEKIKNYRASLQQGLDPHSLDDFPVCFLDAKDYCEGMDEHDPELVGVSRFSEFIDELNKFITEHDKLAQLDTPTRRVLTYAEEVEAWFVQHPEQDRRFLEALTRITRQVRHERCKLNTVVVNSINLRLTEKIRGLGRRLAEDLPTFTSKDVLEQRIKQIELEIEKICVESKRDFEEAIQKAIESLRDDVREILNSEPINDFVVNIDADMPSVPTGFDPKSFKRQVGVISGFAEFFGLSLVPTAQNLSTALANILSQATRAFVKVPGNSNTLLRNIDVIGSPLKRNILGLGKSVGIKFKPFQAVKITSNLGNAARLTSKALPIAATIANVGLTLRENHEQQKQAIKLREMQRKIEDEFGTIARNLEDQITEQQRQFEEHTFDYIEMQIREERENYERQQTSNTMQTQNLRKVQECLNSLIDEIRSLRY